VMAGFLLLMSCSSHMRKGDSSIDHIVFSLILLILSFSPVLSPQYILWIALPLFYHLFETWDEKTFARRDGFIAGILVLVCVLTQLLYPYLYESFYRDESLLSILVLTMRNSGLLLLLTLFLFRPVHKLMTCKCL
jgi:hypothetical protein